MVAMSILGLQRTHSRAQVLWTLVALLGSVGYFLAQAQQKKRQQQQQ